MTFESKVVRIDVVLCVLCLVLAVVAYAGYRDAENAREDLLEAMIEVERLDARVGMLSEILHDVRSGKRD